LGTSIKLCLIVARAENGVIGKDNDLPWRLSDDLKHFKATTKGCPVVMGRKTWESLPKRPLPGRDNIVLSRDGQYMAEGARVFTSIEAAIETARSLARMAGMTEVFVTGGSAIYAPPCPSQTGSISPKSRPRLKATQCSLILTNRTSTRLRVVR